MPDVTTADFTGLAGPLVLRLQEADDAGDVRTQVVRITARRCAIGSDSTCNLQIRTGASPLDCLIVRGRERTVVRRWTTETLLAGGEPCDAVLVPGDRFEVGQAEFEVLESDALADNQPDEPVVEIADEPNASLREVALQNWQSNARLRRGCTLNRQRARRLAEQLRACRAELAELKQSMSEGTLEWESHSPAPLAAEPVEDTSSQAECEEETAESEDLRFEAISADAPVTASALLGRLGVTLPEDDQVEDGPPTIAASAAPTVAERSAFSVGERQPHEGRHPPANSDVRDEEESVEDYMSRLLERVRQKADSPQTSYQPVPIAAPRAPERPAPEAVAVIDDKPAPLTELPARRGRPDEAVDLSAMRELAHMHAQSVLDTHFRRRFQRSSIGRMGVVAGSLILGVVLACLAVHWPLAIYPAMLSFAVAIVWGGQYALSMRQIAAMRDEPAADDSSCSAAGPAARVVDDRAAPEVQPKI